MTFPCCPIEDPCHDHGGRAPFAAPAPELEPEWDSEVSGDHQARVEAGAIDQYGEPRQPGRDEWGMPEQDAEAEAGQ